MSMVQAHDAAVAGLSTVEAKEVFAVQAEQDAVFATGVAKDFVIRPSLPGVFGFQNGGDIAAESPEFLDDGQGKFFVGVEPQHTGSVRLVFGDGACDFRAMGAVVGPGVGEVFGVERGIAAEKIGFAEAKLAGAGECPDRNARAADAGFAPADGGVAVHAGEALAKVARHDLQQGRFFTRRHGGEERFGVGEKWHRDTVRKIATLQPVAKVLSRLVSGRRFATGSARFASGSLTFTPRRPVDFPSRPASFAAVMHLPNHRLTPLREFSGHAFVRRIRGAFLA